ncbi:Recyclin-1 [Zancudomyces culisetae]|uniref:Recyclin-1 n=1 Tax=Zancudomyces culisetae TaxID=1213189 RepID=A0A1R1PC43_ZANCU|nr:Recyclin-1 [Zancudomyces culisetae]OMH85242.1 Recyclin-1 [Zancudomyces culisetae]|eukprot:OMH78536.1 Recyclin-1 [Zancudomyces culisetae]
MTDDGGSGTILGQNFVADIFNMNKEKKKVSKYEMFLHNRERKRELEKARTNDERVSKYNFDRGFDWLMGKEVDGEWWHESPVTLTGNKSINLEFQEFEEFEDILEGLSDDDYENGEENKKAEEPVGKLIDTQDDQEGVAHTKKIDKKATETREVPSLSQSGKDGGSFKKTRGYKPLGVLKGSSRNKSKIVQWGRLPPRVLANISVYLDVEDCVEVFRARKLWYHQFLQRDGPYGGILWRLMLGRMGWRCIRLRIEGMKEKIVWDAPSCMWSLLKRVWGVKNCNELTELVEESAYHVFRALYRYYIRGYVGIIKPGGNGLKKKISQVLGMRESNKKLLIDLAEEIEQYMWFGRGLFHRKSTQINKKLLSIVHGIEEDLLEELIYYYNKDMSAQAQVYARILSKIRQGESFVRYYLNTNELLESGWDEAAEEVKAIYDDEDYDMGEFSIDPECVDLGCINSQKSKKESIEHQLVRISENITDAESYEGFLAYLTSVLVLEAYKLQKNLGMGSLVQKTICSLVLELFQRERLVGRVFERIFDQQNFVGAESSEFLKTIADIVALGFEVSQKWCSGVCLLECDNRSSSELRKKQDGIIKSLGSEAKHFVFAVPSEIGKKAVFSSISEKQVLYYLSVERNNLMRGWSAALEWHTSGMKAILQSAAKASDQMIFFTTKVWNTVKDPSLRFRSAIAILESGGSGGAGGGESNLPDTPPNIKSKTNMDGTDSSKDGVSRGTMRFKKFIRTFKFSEHSKNIEKYKTFITFTFLKRLGVTDEDIRSGVKSELIDLLFKFSEENSVKLGENNSSNGGKQPQNDHHSSFSENTPGSSDAANFLGFGKVELNVPLCLSMILFTHDAIMRIMLFTSANQDSDFYKWAKESIENTFCGLLNSIGYKHIKPAFDNIISELRQLQSQIGSLSAIIPKTSGSSSDFGAGEKSTALDLFRTKSKSFQNSKIQLLIQDFDTSIGIDLVISKRITELVSMYELLFFELVNMSDLILSLIEVYYKLVITLVVDEMDFLSLVNQEKRALERVLDDSVVLGVDCIIETIMRQVENVLNTQQKPEDYCPAMNISLQLKPTIACVRAVQMLTESADIISMLTLSQKALGNVYLAEIGHRLFSILTEHIKRFSISQPGGFQLIADLNLYSDFVNTEIVNGEISEKFKALLDLANCFILAPKDLRDFLKDLYSRSKTFDSVFRGEEVYEFVARRSDYARIRNLIEGYCDFM